MKPLGIVLAGGRSRRFGRDKALAVFGGRTLLEHSVHALKDLELEACVVTEALRDYSYLNCRIEKDRIPQAGPLGGLFTACDLYAGASLLVLTCDMPAVTPSSLMILMRTHRGENRATVYSVPGGIQPFPGIYESTLREDILRYLEEGGRSVRLFLKGIPESVKVSWTGDPHVFLNINRAQDVPPQSRG